MIPPSRPLFWIANSIKRNGTIHPNLAFDVHSVVGRPARTTTGLVPAAMSGIRLTREEYAPSVFTGGLQHSVSLVAAGRRTPIGMRIHKIHSHCVEVPPIIGERRTQDRFGATI